MFLINRMVNKQKRVMSDIYKMGRTEKYIHKNKSPIIANIAGN